jgi:hypothetical protein
MTGTSAALMSRPRAGKHEAASSLALVDTMKWQFVRLAAGEA